MMYIWCCVQMVFSTNQMTGAHDEIMLANASRFRNIRLFTVAPTNDAISPHTDPTVMQPWVAADSSSVGGGPANKSFSYFSAVW